MIERRIGAVFVPTKNKDVIRFGNHEAIVSDQHTLIHREFRKPQNSRLRFKDISWHFYEEINADNTPWQNRLRFHRDNCR